MPSRHIILSFVLLYILFNIIIKETYVLNKKKRQKITWNTYYYKVSITHRILWKKYFCYTCTNIIYWIILSSSFNHSECKCMNNLIFIVKYYKEKIYVLYLHNYRTIVFYFLKDYYYYFIIVPDEDDFYNNFLFLYFFT